MKRHLYAGLFSTVLYFVLAMFNIAQADEICAGQSVPDGWMITDISTNYTRCDRQTQNNIWTIQNTANQSELYVCANQALPSGWLLVDIDTNYTRCDRQTQNNIWIIQNTANQSNLLVCANQSLPSGWTRENIYTNYTRCDRQTQNNIWSIRNLNVSCGLSVNPSVVGAGQAYNFILSTTGISAGQAYWYGSKNGQFDSNGVYLGGSVPGVFSFVNAPGIDGSYWRSVQIRNAQGTTICSTNSVNVTLQPTPTCSLSISTASASLGQSYTFVIGGTNLPSDALGYWYGTKNGVVDTNGDYAGAVPANLTYDYSIPGIAGSYSREMEIRSANRPICRTNSVTISLQ